MTAFKKGDLIVEYSQPLRRTSELLRAGEEVSLGVVVEVHENDVLSVLFPIGQLYTFAGYCQLAKEWLNENF